MTDVRLGPRTAFHRSIAREQWQPLVRHPEFIQGVVVLVAGLFTVVGGSVLLVRTGEAFLQVLFGLACVGWGAARLRERWPAFVAWRAIGAVGLSLPAIEVRQGEPIAASVHLRPRRPLVIRSCTLTVWSREQRGGAQTPGPAWAFDLPVPAETLPAGRDVRLEGSIEVPPPPDAAPSRFDGAFTRQWLVTAEVETDRGAWRRDYPVLVFP